MANLAAKPKIIYFLFLQTNSTLNCELEILFYVKYIIEIYGIRNLWLLNLEFIINIIKALFPYYISKNSSIFQTYTQENKKFWL